eukprot:CAMPEP_0174951906 /NCGR_PEP_ID=MMETSP1355-20121228/95095_1 /TAXON_ID=464990 /ORGANISM="Hemiselmis tepida, Strain CCMP443" /LENGTH=50 /DNA_ID=CAMNT_0016199585 /DNA_START=975 /DNA_END=1127 /DNA_ORIENTATION=-
MFSLLRQFQQLKVADPADGPIYFHEGYQAGFMKGVSDSGFTNCHEGEDCK